MQAPSNGLLDPFNASVCLESGQAKYVTSVFNSELKYEKLAAALIIIIIIIIIITLLETLRMKIKQLVIFTILNYIYSKIFAQFKKKLNYMITIKNYFTMCEY